MSAKSVQQWIEIRDAGTSASGLTRVWSVFNKYRNEECGQIRWWGAGRKYIWYPQDGAGFDADLLRMVADKLDEVNGHRKEARKRAKM